ncbi:MAG: hypothetical protein AB8G99_25565 [Planctomycetaceae bacterium]
MKSEIAPMKHRSNIPALTTIQLLNRGHATSFIPVTTGICLPRGTVSDPSRLSIVNGEGESILTQVDVSESWSDGSAKWVLLSFVANELPRGESTWSLSLLEKPPALPAMTVGVTENSTGGLEVLFGGQKRETTFPADADFQFKPLKPVVREGLVRSEYCFRRSCTSTGLRFECRVTRWRECNRIRFDVKLHNPNAAKHPGGLWDLGDSGSIQFERFAIHVGGPIDSIGWLAEDGQELEWTDLSKRLIRGLPFSILQASSGHEHWNSSNHIDASGKTRCAYRGYKAETPRGQITGLHASPVVVGKQGRDAFSMFVPEFWQQFPNALHAGKNGLRAGLFPDVDGKHELQGGEQKTQSVWISADNEPRVDVVAFMRADWVARCQVLPWFDDQTTAAHDKVNRFLSESLCDGNSWEQRRQVIDEYGWRNFGDVHADHEQRHFDGDGTIVSHYNNQFDLIVGGVQHHLRTGDVSWFDFFDQLARHVADIDIYHTTKDRGVYNGGLFWHTDHYADAATSTHRTYSKKNAIGKDGYGGGQSDEHNYTTGLLFHHYLTGNMQSRDAVIELADWVLNMDDGTQTIFSLVDDGPSGLASATKDPDFHGPGRGSGNSVNALLDAWFLTKERRYLTKADELIRRVVHPGQDLDALDLLNSEKRWSYPVFLMALARYLDAKIEMGELDEMYAYGRATMQHYGRWMAENERPALSRPDELEYVTEAWPVQDVRKANGLRLCAQFEDDMRWVDRMRGKADEIAAASWEELYDFEDRYNARAISVLMTEGLRDAWHQNNPPRSVAPVPDWSGDFGSWEMFVGQRDRVKAAVKDPKALLSMAGRAIHPKRWVRFVRAARRQF